MKICMIVFSPSGNTLNVANTLKEALTKRGECVQLIDISNVLKTAEGGLDSNQLESIVLPHDVLIIGSPVYAHHFQYHMKELIEKLPNPNDKWGKYCIPFVTYGGLNSGIALDEASVLLKAKERTVIGGFKIAASHKMTRAFYDEEVNHMLPNQDQLKIEMNELADYIVEGNYSDHSELLKYKTEVAYHVANTIFIEKVCHEKMYPKITLDSDRCLGCGKCHEVCPVGHVIKTYVGTFTLSEAKSCIHCFNCALTCPNGSIVINGDIQKAREFMNNTIKQGMEKPENQIFI